MGMMDMGGMGGGGGGGGMMGGMGNMFGGEKKEYTGQNHGKGFVCGESEGGNIGKWVGTIAGTVVGAYFGVPMLGIAGGQAGKSIGSQMDPSVCTPRMDMGSVQGKPPMPPSSEGLSADATGSANEQDSKTQTPDTQMFSFQAPSFDQGNQMSSRRDNDSFASLMDMYQG